MKPKDLPKNVHEKNVSASNTNPKYSTRNNPRLSFLNKSLSSIPKPNKAKSVLPIVSHSQPSTSVKSKLTNIRPNNSGKNNVSNSKPKVPTVSSAIPKVPTGSSALPTRKSYNPRLNSTPNDKRTSAAFPSLTVSRPSADFQTSNSGNPSSSVSSVLSDKQLIIDKVIASDFPTTSPVNNQSSASLHDVNRKYSISQLLCERNVLIDKISELTTQLEHQNVGQTVAPPTTGISPPTTSISLPSKVALFSDSMCRGVAHLMSTQLTNTRITSDVKPGAVFSQVTESIASQCNDFGPKDYVFIQAGTNDMHSLQPNSTKRLQLPASLINLSNKTNIVFCSIPYRYDSQAHLSTNIYETNNFLKYACAKFDFFYLDTNSFMYRPLYTKEGLHYNRRGKSVLATKFVDLINTRVSAIRKFLSLTTNNTEFKSPTIYQSSPCNSRNVRTIASVTSNVQTIAPTRTQFCDVGTQVRAYDIDVDSSFGSLGPDIIDLINLSGQNDDLLSSPTISYPIPVISSNVPKNSNFISGDRTPAT
uniref:SGNH hydrolase-type esterase domain-containing protein n=1 Tax=Cacopsylla melanoneura TaxID=428564 RepID=A0A8D9F949_9HEMI